MWCRLLSLSLSSSYISIRYTILSSFPHTHTRLILTVVLWFVVLVLAFLHTHTHTHFFLFLLHAFDMHLFAFTLFIFHAYILHYLPFGYVYGFGILFGGRILCVISIFIFLLVSF